jgi:hypothetical protein
MMSSALPLYLWCYIIPSVLELVNKTAVTNRDLTPYQAFFNEIEPSVNHIPDLSRYKIIGSECKILIPLENRAKSQKLRPRTEAARLLAVLGSNTYLVYVPSRHAVLKTSFIKLYEAIGTVKRPSSAREGVNIPESEVENPAPDVIPASRPWPSGLGPLGSGPGPPITGDTVPEGVFQPPTTAPNYAEEPENHTPKVDDPMDLDLVYHLTNKVKFNTLYSNSSVPYTFKQALKSPERDLWLRAIFKEFDQVIRQGVLKFLPKSSLPENRKPIASRLVLRKKLAKYKARLVVKGF